MAIANIKSCAGILSVLAIQASNNFDPNTLASTWRVPACVLFQTMSLLEMVTFDNYVTQVGPINHVRT